MAEQFALFPTEIDGAREAAIRTHHDDPITSLLAVRELIDSGALTHQQDVARRAAESLPGLTSDELGHATGLDRYMLARRLPEVARAGRLIQGPARKSTRTGRMGVTWWPTGSDVGGAR